MIDLIQLYSGNVSDIVIDGEYVIPEDKIKNSNIFELSKISVIGKIKKIEDDYYLEFNSKGKMKISDSITLERVWYDFNID